MRTVKVFEEAWPLHTPFVIAREVAVKRAWWWLNWKKMASKVRANVRLIRAMAKVMPR